MRFFLFARSRAKPVPRAEATRSFSCRHRTCVEVASKPMLEPPKVLDQPKVTAPKPRVEPDHGIVFVVGIRLIQLLIILVLWLIMR
jgi:hypothetical protein